MPVPIDHSVDPFRNDLCRLMRQRIQDGETTVDINGIVSLLIEHPPTDATVYLAGWADRIVCS